MPKKFAPKSKKEDSADESSSSDSGPEDRNPPPSKKARSAAPSSGASSKKSADSEEPTWSLDKRRMVKVREFKSKAFIDIREYYEADGDLRPGKKGISLTPQQWQKLKEIIPEVDEALKNV